MTTLTKLAVADPTAIDSFPWGGRYWAAGMLCVGLIMQISEFVYSLCLSITGQHLTRNLRHEMMSKLLRMEVGYFDHEENTMGALTEFLGAKVALIQGLVGEQIGLIARGICMFVTTLVVMFTAGDWMVCLVVFACLPVLGGAMGTAMAAAMPMGDGNKQDKDADKKKNAGSLIGEVVLGIRTVASFNAEVRFGLR